MLPAIFLKMILVYVFQSVWQQHGFCEICVLNFILIYLYVLLILFIFCQACSSCGPTSRLFVLWNQHRGHGLEVVQVLHIVPYAKDVLHMARVIVKKSGQKQSRKQCITMTSLLVYLKLANLKCQFHQHFNKLLLNKSPKILKKVTQNSIILAP